MSCMPMEDSSVYIHMYISYYVLWGVFLDECSMDEIECCVG